MPRHNIVHVIDARRVQRAEGHRGSFSPGSDCWQRCLLHRVQRNAESEGIAFQSLRKK